MGREKQNTIGRDKQSRRSLFLLETSRSYLDLLGYSFMPFPQGYQIDVWFLLLKYFIIEIFFLLLRFVVLICLRLPLVLAEEQAVLYLVNQRICMSDQMEYLEIHGKFPLIFLEEEMDEVKT